MVDGEGASLLHVHCRRPESTEIVRFLVKEVGMDVNSLDRRARTPLYEACTHGALETARFLLEECDDRVAVMSSKFNEWNPLHSAANKNHVDIVSLLLKHGVERGLDVCARNKEGSTALGLACRNGHEACVRALLRETDRRTAETLFRTLNTNNRTVLHSACFSGSVACVEEILKFAAERSDDLAAVLFTTKDKSGGTPYHDAAKNVGTGGELVRLLLRFETSRRNGRNSCATRNAGGRSPLHVAAQHDAAGAAEALLEGALLEDGDAESWKDNQGRSALYVCFVHGSSRVAEVLCGNARYVEKTCLVSDFDGQRKEMLEVIRVGREWKREAMSRSFLRFLLRSVRISALPRVQLGTYRLVGEEAYKSVRTALEIGYRAFDTAQFYDNEGEIGRAILDSGVNRDEVFVTTKVWNSHVSMGKDAVRASVERSLVNLLGHLDCVLIHWPVITPNSAAPAEALKELLAMKREGKISVLGVSNFDVEDFETLDRFLGPDLVNEHVFVNQIEFSPFLYRPRILEYCRSRGISVTAYRSMGKGLPTRLGDARLDAVATSHARTPAQVLIQYSVHHGCGVMPKSKSPERMEENAWGAFDFVLTPDEVERLNGVTNAPQDLQWWDENVKMPSRRNGCVER